MVARLAVRLERASLFVWGAGENFIGNSLSDGYFIETWVVRKRICVDERADLEPVEAKIDLLQTSVYKLLIKRRGYHFLC